LQSSKNREQVFVTTLITVFSAERTSPKETKAAAWWPDQWDPTIWVIMRIAFNN